MWNYFPESPYFFYLLKDYRRSRFILNNLSLRYFKKKQIAVFIEEARDENLTIDKEYIEGETNKMEEKAFSEGNMDK
jgi:lipase chaperone LimK